MGRAPAWATGLEKENEKLRRVGRELEEALEISRAILVAAVVAIITIDEYGPIEPMNPAAIKMFGYAPEGVLKRNSPFWCARWVVFRKIGYYMSRIG